MYTRRIVEASIEVHGAYFNGGDMQRTYVHDVIANYHQYRDIEPLSADELAEKLTSAAKAIQEPSQDLIDAVKAENANLAFEGRWGYQGSGALAAYVLKEAGIDDEGLIASLTRSELDAEWVAASDLEQIRSHASVILGARAIAGCFHRLDIVAANSD